MAIHPEHERALTRARQLLTIRGYKRRTTVAYLQWMRQFAEFYPKRAPSTLGQTEVEDFLHMLTQERGLAPKSRNQATSALAFLFREVFGRDDLAHVRRAREPRRVPTVLSDGQVRRVLCHLSGKYRLLASLMYGAGLRVLECHQLRVKDVDFELMQITVRDGKGGKDRWVMLPEVLAPPLRRQIERVKSLHDTDRAAGAGWVQLPGALHRKDPNAGFTLGWQFLFPASRLTKDRASGLRGRYHLHPTAMQRSMKRAARACGIHKPITCHTLRRSFATQMLRAGYDVRSVQKLMGHRDIRTTMIYVQAVTDAGIGVRSPLDQHPPRD